MGVRGTGRSVGEFCRLATENEAEAAALLESAGRDAERITAARARKRHSDAADVPDAVRDAIVHAWSKRTALAADVRNADASLAGWIAGVAWNFVRRTRSADRRRRDAVEERESTARAEGRGFGDAETEFEEAREDCDVAATPTVGGAGAHDDVARAPPESSATTAGGDNCPDAGGARPCTSSRWPTRVELAARLRDVHLTTKQRAVVDLLGAGRTRAEAAFALGMSEDAVRAHFARAKRRASGMARAMTAGAPWWGVLADRVESVGRGMDARIYRLRGDGLSATEITREVHATLRSVRSRIERGVDLARRLGLAPDEACQARRHGRRPDR